MNRATKSTKATHTVSSIAEKVAWYALLACTAFVPLVTSITWKTIGGTHALTSDAFQVPKAMALAVLVGIAALAWVADMVLHQRDFRVSPAYLPLGLFAIGILLSTSFSGNPLSALFGASSLMTGAVTWLLCILMAVLLGQYVDSMKRLSTLTWAVVGGYGIVAVIALLQALRLDVMRMGYEEADIWWTLQGMSTTGNPNATGLLLVLPFSLALAAAFAAKEARLRWVAGVAAGVMGGAIFITIARASWIGAVLAAAVFIAFAFRTKVQISKRTLAVFATAAVAIVLMGILVATPHELGKRFDRLDEGLDSFSTGRLALWQTTARVIADDPVLGAGPDRLGVEAYKFQTDVVVDEGQRYVPQDPHNFLLLIPALFGIPAALVFIGFIVMELVAALRLAGGQEGYSEGRLFYLGWVAGLLGILVSSLLSVWTFTSVFVFFVAAGTLLGPTLKPTDRNWVGPVVAVLAVPLVVVAAFGIGRGFAASYHLNQAYVVDPQANLEESVRQTPWDGGMRINYLWRKVGASGQLLTNPNATLARQTVDGLDTEIRLAIADFPDELLLYRLRMDLHASLKGYAAYQPAKHREAIEAGLKKFPNDPEFKERLEAFGQAQ